jgi:hypothetical protein
MLAAAASIRYPSEQNDALKKVVNYAVQNCEGRIAVVAALAISYPSDQRDTLVKIVDELGSPAYRERCSVANALPDVATDPARQAVSPGPNTAVRSSDG